MKCAKTAETLWSVLFTSKMKYRLKLYSMFAQRSRDERPFDSESKIHA